MVANIVDYGFEMDNKENIIDVFTIVENDEVFLRIRDNCKPFNPNDLSSIIDENDSIKNIGIKIVSKIAKHMNYQSTFGMNVSSIKL